MTSFILAASLVALLPAAAAEGASVEESLAARFPNIEAEDIRPSPVDGLWEIAVGAQVFYISADGRYLLRGDLVDLMTDRNITELRRAEQAKGVVAGLDEKEMIVFSPENPTHTVTVFTDIDCTYCRKLHREIETFTSRGIKVRYMFSPLAGPGSPSWAKAEAVWCSPDRNDAMTRAKMGEEVRPQGACNDTPVAAHYRIASELGVRGTPGILTDEGRLIPGYVPAERLLGLLEQ